MVRLPRFWRTAPATGGETVDTGDRRLPLVLVVDDDAVFRHALRGMLQGLADRVVEARDGLDALDALRRFHPDLVLLDLRMPGLDGYGVLARRHEVGAGDVPIVIVTSVEPDDAERAALEGASMVLSKESMTPSRVAEIVAQVAERSRSGVR